MRVIYAISNHLNHFAGAEFWNDQDHSDAGAGQRQVARTPQKIIFRGSFQILIFHSLDIDDNIKLSLICQITVQGASICLNISLSSSREDIDLVVPLKLLICQVESPI